MKRIFIAALLFTAASIGLFAQQPGLAPCGTAPQRSEWLREFQQRPTVLKRSMMDTLYVALTLHVVGRDDGSGYIRDERLLSAFCTLNEDFKESAIQFYLKGGIRYIDETDYFDHNGAQGRQMMENNNVPNTINAYVVDNPNGACGYYNGLGITMAKSCMGPNDHTWAHEVGHYLSLPHPFRGWEGQDDFDYSQPAPDFIEFYGSNVPVEKVNGSNCNNAGDGFCDTSPDYLSFRWNCNLDSESIVVQTDPNGAEFRSDGTLIMGYSNDQCAARFTEGQIAAMRANLQQVRPGHLNNQTPPAPISSLELNPVYPLEGELVPNNTAIELEWAPIPGARQYFVEVSIFPTFGFVLLRYSTSGTSATIGADELIPDRTFYWRLRPFNFYDGCTGFTEPASFELGDLASSTSEAAPVQALRLFPNPAREGQEVAIEFFSDKAIELQWSLIAPTGQILRRQRAGTRIGNNRISLPISGLPKGLYIIRLEDGEQSTHRKLLVQ